MEFMETIQNFSTANINMQFMMRNKDNSSSCYSYTLNEHLNNPETTYIPANVILQKLSKTSNKPKVPHVYDNNLKKKFENFTKYINNKENSLMMKDTMNNFNHMNTNCSEFFTYPKGYSYVSNSVASYLIGGFVGSKSQMNNEKHKLSYDLGEVVLRILNDYKYDKLFDKLKVEKKFESNKMGRKSKFSQKDQTDVFEYEYNMAIWNSLVDKSSSSGEKSNRDDSCDKIMEVKQENVKNLSQAAVEAEQNVGEIVNDKENCLPNDAEFGSVIKLTDCHSISSDSSDCSEDPVDVINNNDNVIKKTPSECRTESESKIDKSLSDVNISNIASPFSNSSLIEPRRRQCSECSTESTDSDSFIVFESSSCDSSPEELSNLYYQESEHDESDSYYEEEEDDCDNDECDESYGVKSSDDCYKKGNFKAVMDANKKWREAYKDAERTERNGISQKTGRPKKKVRQQTRRRHFIRFRKLYRVRFCRKSYLFNIIRLGQAYRRARRGPWELMARDRGRFTERINRLSEILTPVLLEPHRSKIYEKFFQ